jgi:hypothetical protein
VSGKIQPMSRRGWPVKIAHWDTDYSNAVC